MTQLPQNSTAWERAGADAKPPASGEQIERDPTRQPPAPGAAPVDEEGPGPESGEASDGDGASGDGGGTD